jgi:hypothetical protein
LPTTTPYSVYDFWENLAQWIITEKEYVGSGTIASRTVTLIIKHSVYIEIGFSTDPTYAAIGTTTSDKTLTGFTGLVVNSLKGFEVSGTGIPTGAYITSNTATEVEISSAATATASITLTVGHLTIERDEEYIHQGNISLDITPFLGAGNYPSVACFMNGRLWLGGSSTDPTILWASKPWDYRNFVVFESVEYDTQEQTTVVRVDRVGTTTESSTTLAVTPVIADSMAGKYVSGLYLPYGVKVSTHTAGTGTMELDMPSIGKGTSGVSFSEWKDADTPEYETVTETTQQIGDSNAIQIRLATEENERILWIAAGKDLYIGTTSSEWAVPGGVTATSVQATIISRYGSADIQARMVGDSLLFVSPSSRHVRQMKTGDPVPPLSIQAEHMIKDGIVQIDFQQSPDVCIYAVLSTGDMVRCIMEPTSGIFAWDRVRTKALDLIESVCVVPGSDEDLVYVCVKRIIGANTVRMIELFQENDDTDYDESWYLDSALSATNATPFHAITLAHLPSVSVDIAYKSGTSLAFDTVTTDANGIALIPLSGSTVYPSISVTINTPTLTGFSGLTTNALAGLAVRGTGIPDGTTISSNTATECTMSGNASASGTVSVEIGTLVTTTFMIGGLPYTATLKTHRIESMETEGLTKAVGRLFFRLLNSYGFTIKYSSVSGTPQAVVIPTATPYTGPIHVTTDIPTLIDAEIIIESSDPVPVGIQIILPETVLGG